MNKKNDIGIILMGDSVLDNFFWLENPNNDIENQLRNLILERLKRFYSVKNLALDETQSKDIFQGKIPSINYVNLRKKLNRQNYSVESDGYFRPLLKLKKLKFKKTFVILSIGGNDARVQLKYENSDKIFDALIKAGFKDNYKKAVDEIYKICKNIILVICYRPGPDFYKLMQKNEIDKLYVKVVPYMLKIAREYKLPVIDLSRTFDTNDHSHYGDTPIEPSNKSGLFICELILKVLIDYKFLKESKIYYGINKIKIEENNTDYIYKLD